MNASGLSLEQENVNDPNTMFLTINTFRQNVKYNPETKIMSDFEIKPFFLTSAFHWFLSFIFNRIKKEASRGAAAQSVTVKPTGCGFDPHSRR